MYPQQIVSWLYLVERISKEEPLRWTRDGKYIKKECYLEPRRRYVKTRHKGGTCENYNRKRLGWTSGYQSVCLSFSSCAGLYLSISLGDSFFILCFSPFDYYEWRVAPKKLGIKRMVFESWSLFPTARLLQSLDWNLWRRPTPTNCLEW